MLDSIASFVAKAVAKATTTSAAVKPVAASPLVLREDKEEVARRRKRRNAENLIVSSKKRARDRKPKGEASPEMLEKIQQSRGKVLAMKARKAGVQTPTAPTTAKKTVATPNRPGKQRGQSRTSKWGQANMAAFAEARNTQREEAVRHFLPAKARKEDMSSASTEDIHRFFIEQAVLLNGKSDQEVADDATFFLMEKMEGIHSTRVEKLFSFDLQVEELETKLSQSGVSTKTMVTFRKRVAMERKALEGPKTPSKTVYAISRRGRVKRPHGPCCRIFRSRVLGPFKRATNGRFIWLGGRTPPEVTFQNSTAIRPSQEDGWFEWTAECQRLLAKGDKPR